MPRLSILIGVSVLVLAACGGSDSDTTSAGGDPTTTTSAAVGATTTTGGASDTTAPEDTTTTTVASAGRAVFTITEVGLGPLSQVFIQNVGDATGSLAGHWLCQRPAYYELPDVELQPGDVAQIYVTGHDDTFGPRSGAILVEGTATIGTLDPADGEVGLYSSNSFGSSSDIVSYVEWGTAGHGRSGTAVAAGIWAEGFVPTTAESGAILATTIPATDPSHWTGG